MDHIFELVRLVAPRHAIALEVLLGAERDAFAFCLPVALHEGPVRLGVVGDRQYAHAAGGMMAELGAQDGWLVGGRSQDPGEGCEEQGEERDLEEHGVSFWLSFLGVVCRRAGDELAARNPAVDVYEIRTCRRRAWLFSHTSLRSISCRKRPLVSRMVRIDAIWKHTRGGQMSKTLPWLCGMLARGKGFYNETCSMR